MGKADRLLQLLQILRNHRAPVGGRFLSEQLQVSLRTLYRDIASLRNQGAEIEGEPGVGYLMKPGFFLPPLMFSEAELEAITLGMQWVKQYGDVTLARSACTALSKVQALLPDELNNSVDGSTLRVGPPPKDSGREDLSRLRTAIRDRSVIRLNYRSSGQEKEPQLEVFPVTIGYFPEKRVLVAWNEASNRFMYFQTDQISKLTVLQTRYTRGRGDLFQQWQQEELKKREP